MFKRCPALSSRRAALVVTIALTSWTVLGAEGADAGGRPMVPEDYFSFRFVSNLQISPDGQEVLFVVSDVKEDRSGRDRSIWIVSSDGSKDATRLTAGTGDGSPLWSPDGSRIAFLRRGPESTKSDADKSSQVFLLPRDGGEAMQASHIEGGVGGMRWMPDGERMILTLSGPRAKPKSKEGEVKNLKPDVDVVKDAVYKANGRGYLDERRQHLFLFETGNGSTTQLTEGETWTETGPEVSPDGNSLVFSSNRTGDQFDGDWTSGLWAVGLDDVNAESVPAPIQLTSQDYSSRSAKISPDGQTVAYVRTDQPYGDQPDIFVQPLRTNATPRSLSDEFDRNPTGLTWSRDGSHILFTTNDRGSARLFRINVKTGAAGRLLDEGQSVRSLSVSSGTNRIAFTLESERMLPEVYVAEDDGSGLRQLTHLNRDILAPIARGPLEEIWFDNDGGGKSQGFLLRPTVPTDGEKVPLVLNIKGGPGGMWGHQWFHEFQMLAGQGWAVAFVNYRGSHGYGYAHQNSVHLDYGGVDYRDNMKLVDVLLDRYDWIDSDKLFLTGGSHGGFLTNWIVSQTPRFRAAVTQRSVSSWVSEAGTQQYPPRRMQQEFGGSLWSNWDLYWDRSPLKHAHRVKTPTLIIHSDQDMICPIGQAEEWFYALKTLGVPTEMVIFRGENHSLSRSGTPVNLVERLRRIIGWFERYGG